MPEIQQLSQVTTLPGIKRDGTILDGDQWSAGQWVRFNRGRIRKMGGYQQISNQLTGPIRDIYVWSRASMNAIFSCSTSKVEMILVDNNGLGSSIVDRTPAGFIADANHIWSTDSLFNSASTNTALLAHASLSMTNIDDPTEQLAYYGDMSTNTALTSLGAIGPNGVGVSGGLVSIAPYAVFYSSDGYVQWSDANQPTVLTSGDAGNARATGAKIVKGLPLRSGAGPAGLLWSLDSVVRMDYIGGQAIFKFTHLTSQSSILAQNSVIEYDNRYFWMGIDRFLMTDGSSVQELPNQMNINWVFDNLNQAQRQKVWAMKVPRFGEIWWFFPFGNATECTTAVIYNLRENTWYDTACARSAGYYAQVFHYPVMADTGISSTSPARLLVLSGVIGTISVGDTVRGTSSGALATVTFIDSANYYVSLISTGTEFLAAEGVVDNTSAATATVSTASKLYQVYLHEKGTDAVIGDNVDAIEATCTTCDFGYPTGGPAGPNQPTGLNRWTRVVKIEPDFVMSGNMTVEVLSREYPQSSAVVQDSATFNGSSETVDLRAQARNVQLRFTMNEVGGTFEQGRVILWTEPGDLRA